MAYAIPPPVDPMLAQLQDEVPEGEGWLYEPKWDGFRAIVFRDGEQLHLQSRNQQPLERYFPELMQPLAQALPPSAVVDGEIVIAGRKGLDFDALLQRIHPASSRITRLSRETPASFVAFDLLAEGADDLRERPFAERRAALARALTTSDTIFLTPQSDRAEDARAWFERFEGAGLDGVVAKRAELPYRPGERVMVKVKHLRTADCVVGGYRRHKSGEGVGSLLLGLYDAQGVLQHVGSTSSFSAKQRREVLQQLAPLAGGSSFGEGRSPGAPSRWASQRDTAWTAVSPRLVCEVAFDHLQGERFRHATRFLRWRPDKDASDCTFAQLEPPRPFSLSDVLALSHASP